MVYIDDESSISSEDSFVSIDSLLSTSYLHPSLAISLTSPSLSQLTLSEATVLIYDKIPSARTKLRDVLINRCKRVLVATSSHDAIDIIKRNNSDILR